MGRLNIDGTHNDREPNFDGSPGAHMELRDEDENMEEGM